MFADRSLADLLEQVAARRPAPGGGSSAGWTSALAAALVEMSAAFSLERPESGPRMREVRARASQLRAAGLELAERELSSYAPVLEAMRLPREDPARAERVRAALGEASEAPLAVARAAAEVAELGAEVAEGGNEHLRGDAVAGTLLAEAACRAAATLAELNLRGHEGDPRLREVAALTARAAAARARVSA